VATIHGPAGSGKTTLMREAVNAVETLSGKDVVVLAPSASAVQVLKNDGFAQSDTFQRFMADGTFQDVAKGHILWVDEAGFLSVKEMNWLVQFANRNKCRLIFSGDTRQHYGVERGDALRILENSGAVIQAVLTKIIRQKIDELRQAIFDLSPRAGPKRRARASMHLFTDSKVALKEAVTHSSERLSPCEVISKNGDGGEWRNVVSTMHNSRQLTKSRATRPEIGREAVKQIEIER
jgi:AAA domain